MRKTDSTGIEKRASILTRVCAAIAVNSVERLEGGLLVSCAIAIAESFDGGARVLFLLSQQFLFVPKIVICDQLPFIFETKTF